MKNIIFLILIVIVFSCQEKNNNQKSMNEKQNIILDESNTYFSQNCFVAQSKFVNNDLYVKIESSKEFNYPLTRGYFSHLGENFKQNFKIETINFEFSDFTFKSPENEIIKNVILDKKWLEAVEFIICNNDTICKIINSFDLCIIENKDQEIIQKYKINNTSELLALSFIHPNNIEIDKIWGLLYYYSYGGLKDRSGFDLLNQIIGYTSFETISLSKYKENIGIPPIWELDSIAKKEGITIDSLMNRY